jgi:hypothetical protein
VTEARLSRLCIRQVYGSSPDLIIVRTQLVIEFAYWNRNPNVYINLTSNLYNELGILIWSAGPTYLSDCRDRTFPVGLMRSRCCTREFIDRRSALRRDTLG